MTKTLFAIDGSPACQKAFAWAVEKHYHSGFLFSFSFSFLSFSFRLLHSHPFVSLPVGDFWTLIHVYDHKVDPVSSAVRGGLKALFSNKNEKEPVLIGKSFCSHCV